jgi:hypothetical protein
MLIKHVLLTTKETLLKGVFMLVVT